MTDLKSKFRYDMINIISFKYVERKIDAQINPCYKLLTHCEKSFKNWKVCYYIQNEKDIKLTKLMKRINRINATCTHGKMCHMNVSVSITSIYRKQFITYMPLQWMIRFSYESKINISPSEIECLFHCITSQYQYCHNQKFRWGSDSDK
jgi:5-formyltetrahydrofolate cyclo-ligase